MSRDIAQLTSKELSALEDALNAERLLIKKYKTYALLSTDPQIKTQYEQTAGCLLYTSPSPRDS